MRYLLASLLAFFCYGRPGPAASNAPGSGRRASQPQAGGRVVQALRYTDHTGTYTVVATETGPVPGKDVAENKRADLYAAQYPASGAASWQVHDYQTDCPLDLSVRFVPDGLSVTDLDHNGMAEVWLVYRTTCRGDVSPSTQKIILYEGSRKYALRGTTRVAVGGQSDGGTMAGRRPGRLRRLPFASTPPRSGSNTSPKSWATSPTFHYA